MRGMSKSKDHPHPLDFRYNLRWYDLGKYSSAIFTVNTNKEENNKKYLLMPLQMTTIENEQVKCFFQFFCC